MPCSRDRMLVSPGSPLPYAVSLLKLTHKLHHPEEAVPAERPATADARATRSARVPPARERVPDQQADDAGSSAGVYAWQRQGHLIIPA